ncbi:MAG: methionyl-tRNA formyltransferase, partial [Sphingobacteriales bacterium]
PCAFTFLNDKQLKIYRSSVADSGLHSDAIKNSGEFITDNKSYLAFRAADGFVKAEELQLEGKKRMTVEEFLRGVKL